MFSKGKDLERKYPAIAWFVNNTASISGHDINSFLFVKKPSQRGGNFFRVKGQLGEAQIAMLLRLHNLPKDTVGTQNGEWTEYSYPMTLENTLFQRMGYAEGYGYDLDDAVYWAMDGEDDEENVSAVFVNGKQVDFEKNSYKSVEPRDVVVVLSDNDEEHFGSFIAFEKMPIVNVYRETLAGPFSHPDSDNLWPAELANDSDIRKAWRLGLNDVAICPFCAEEDCSDHTLSANQEVFIRRPNSQGKVLYSLQSPLLVGDDATEILRPFTRTIIGKHISGYDWPEEVAKLMINNNDRTGSTCGEEIELSDAVSVVLKDPRFKIKKV